MMSHHIIFSTVACLLMAQKTTSRASIQDFLDCCHIHPTAMTRCGSKWQVSLDEWGWKLRSTSPGVQCSLAECTHTLEYCCAVFWAQLTVAACNTWSGTSELTHTQHALISTAVTPHASNLRFLLPEKYVVYLKKSLFQKVLEEAKLVGTLHRRLLNIFTEAPHSLTKLKNIPGTGFFESCFQKRNSRI